MSTPTWTGQQLAGRYDLRERLAQNSVAEVYKGLDRELGRDVAVKLLRADWTRAENFRPRFEREARAVAQLRHPNIAQLLDFGVAADSAFLAIEYLPGPTLEGRLRGLEARSERLPLEETLRIVAAAGVALDYAHSRGVSHRSLRPGNIMFNALGDPILTDFGIAEMLGDDVQIGDAHYLSPEQARGDAGDERSDLYSLGVILYEMATGRLPFPGDLAVNVMLKHLSDPPPPPQSLNPGLPAEITQAINTSLAKDPAARYQTAGGLIAALGPLLSRSVGTAGKTQIEPPAPAKQATSARPLQGPPAAHPPTAEVEAAVLEVRPSSAAGTILERPSPVAPIPGPARSLIETPPGQYAPAPLPPAMPPPPSEARAGRRSLAPFIFVAAAGLALLGLVAAVAIGAAFLRPTPPGRTVESGPTVESTAKSQTLPSAEGMVKVEAGTYMLGASADANHIATRSVELPGFWIDRVEVTNAQYAAYAGRTGSAIPYGWKDGHYPALEDQHPVRGVTYDEAAAYCASEGKRLPTEAEWEAAGRGLDARLYPWGGDPGAIKLDSANTYPVGTVAANQSPSGVYDMAGNVWEWVSEPYEPVSSGERVLRGGSYNYLQDLAYRLPVNPTVATAIVDSGFRCGANQVR